jgi:hypothetical protein
VTSATFVGTARGSKLTHQVCTLARAAHPAPGLARPAGDAHPEAGERAQDWAATHASAFCAPPRHGRDTSFAQLYGTRGCLRRRMENFSRVVSRSHLSARIPAGCKLKYLLSLSDTFPSLCPLIVLEDRFFSANILHHGTSSPRTHSLLAQAPTTRLSNNIHQHITTCQVAEAYCFRSYYLFPQVSSPHQRGTDDSFSIKILTKTWVVREKTSGTKKNPCRLLSFIQI